MMLYKLLVALFFITLAVFCAVLVVGVTRVEARHIQTIGGSYDGLLDMGYGIIKYQGYTMLVHREFARTYLDVAWCESKYDEQAEGAAGERGYLQIHPVHKGRIAQLGLTWDSMYEFWPNVRVAYDIWLDNESWSPWSCGR